MTAAYYFVAGDGGEQPHLVAQCIDTAVL